MKTTIFEGCPKKFLWPKFNKVKIIKTVTEEERKALRPIRYYRV